MTDDSELLRQYVERSSQAAFRELVHRHLPLVYHSAVRQLGIESHLAEDVAQSVFVLLSQKSRSLLRHPTLAAWLHSTTHFKVRECLRKERRKRIRDHDAYVIDELMKDNSTEASWERLQPMIDSVLLELNEPDRTAILMRFFEGQPLSAIAAHLGLSENSAQKRVQRALEKLRERLGRHGLNSTAAALSVALGTPTILAAPPPALVATISAVAISTGIPTISTWSVATLMSTKNAVLAGTLTLIISGGISVQQFSSWRRIKTELAGLEQENARLTGRLHAESTPSAPLSPVSSKLSVAITSAPTGPSSSPPTREENRAFLRANPAVQQALYSFIHDKLAAEYQPVITKLGLSAPEKEQFLFLLAQGMVRLVGDRILFVESDDHPVAEQQRLLQALLGESRYREYREFQAAGAERSVTSELAGSLYFTATPLTKVQSTALKEIVARATSDPKLGYRYSGDAFFMPPSIWEKIVAEADGVLSESQLEALRVMQRRSIFLDQQSLAIASANTVRPTPTQTLDNQR